MVGTGTCPGLGGTVGWVEDTREDTTTTLGRGCWRYYVYQDLAYTNCQEQGGGIPDS